MDKSLEWMQDFSQAQLDEIEFATEKYVEFRGPTDGVWHLLLIGKMAIKLNDLEQRLIDRGIVGQDNPCLS